MIIAAVPAALVTAEARPLLYNNNFHAAAALQRRRRRRLRVCECRRDGDTVSQRKAAAAAHDCEHDQERGTVQCIIMHIITY